MSKIKQKYDFTKHDNIKMAEEQELLRKKRAEDSFLKHPMDFGFNCIFKSQLDSKHYIGLKEGNGEFVKIPLKSKRVGLYKVFSERVNYTFSDTGQKNYYFIFIEVL